MSGLTRCQYSCLVVFILSLFSWPVLASEAETREDHAGSTVFAPQLKVVLPFVEWRTGPAQGFPVFHISEKGEWLEVSTRKTEWLKVRDRKGNEGWLNIADVLQMEDANGETVKITEPVFDDFNTRRWEAGLMSGQFDKAALNSAYLGYWMTNNISLELWGSQVLGDSAEIKVASVNLLHQPFPSWKFSPFFTLGAGMVFISPKATLSEEAKRDEESIHAGIGARYYLSDRYFVRMEVKDYKIFTNRE
ncbi:SH3 domain-containing protein, partial [Oleiphilus sp. HI0117]